MKMKYFTAIFVFALFTEISTGFFIKDIFFELGRAVFEDKLKSFLNSLRPILKTGNYSLGIPVLDPFETQYQEINVTDHLVRITGDFTDAKIAGLSDYNVNDAKFQILGFKMSLDMTWSNIKANTLYTFYAELIQSKAFPIFGKGNINISATNFRINASAILGLRSNQVFIKELSAGISLDAIKFDATGIYGYEPASETISAIISSYLPYAIQHYHWLIKDEMDIRLTNLINYYLSNFTLQDIISVIG